MNYEFHDVQIRPGEQIGLHSQATWELDLVLVGSGTRFIGGNEDSFSPGDTVLLPPGVEHRWVFKADDTDADGRIHNISVLFSDEFLDNLGKILPEIGTALQSLRKREPVVFHGATRNAIETLLVGMMNMPPERRAATLPGLLLLLVRTDGRETITRHKGASEADKRAERLRIYCLCNFMHDISIATAAAHVGFNKSALCRFVRQRFGTTFTAYINDLRLDEACRLLRKTDRPVATIAYECGFNNITYFNRLFRAKFHTQPRKYRTES